MIILKKTFVKNLLPTFNYQFCKKLFTTHSAKVKLVLHLNILEIKFLNGDRHDPIFFFCGNYKKKSFKKKLRSFDKNLQ